MNKRIRSIRQLALTTSILTFSLSPRLWADTGAVSLTAGPLTTVPLTTAPLTAAEAAQATIVGTDEPFASDAVYFVLTDRFVDGDPANNYPAQGGQQPTFDQRLIGPDGRQANVGYLGGDFRGLLDNADYIRDMGFTAVWLTPIVDNPNEAFSGGDQVEFGGWGDRGKTGYHGYWGVNFYREDEHLVSARLGFRELTRQLQQQHGLKTVLDVVANHGSPSFDMPQDQPMFGEVYDAEGQLRADHQNLLPPQLTPEQEPLHAFFHAEGDPHTAQLSNFNEDNEALQDYLINAYLYWIDQGAAAFRIDTVKHMPHHFWKLFGDRIRQQHPGFFMFGESYNWEAEKLAEHTWPENGGMSVLDFAGRQAMVSVFENSDSHFASLLDYLHLDDGLYRNPYELMTFYDNHDMSRMNATEQGFIDANNWLFTSRGIPVVYYGSEVTFMAGTREHEGNRNYFGQQRIDAAPGHPVYQQLKQIARLRQQHVALQRGVQVNLDFQQHTASFLRVYQQGGVSETALVLLNKGDSPAPISVEPPVSGPWQRVTPACAADHCQPDVTAGRITTTLAPHSVMVLISSQPVSNPKWSQWRPEQDSGA
ncbi:cyclomaltodextrin glucanotransferase [Aestuariicella hydrocarbonica]|uniref:Alpha-amylase n=1 Tax=Pseudomaricurvus hydrocarbonicus TaxID=1470433 RepID=A0A9E5T476_9GAMM|nr:alpha-amylase family glycosyl hydrolase [Aestuariicella hydrocarbonica]NHO67639.1 cyclomaltodextrin glucanotransferase [Aestuariicella hydrocarbonica]